MVFMIDSLEEASISKKLKTSWLNKKQHQLENGLVNVAAATKLKFDAAKVLLEKKRKFRGDCKAVILNILVKFAEKCPLVCWFICSACCFNLLNMVRHHAESSQLFKHLLIMFLPCIKSKQVLQTSQNHKWMSFWRWLDLIRRRSLRSLISAKIVWMYFLVITSRSAMRNYGRFLWLYLRFYMIKFSHKRASQSQRCDCPQHNLTAHFLWWHLTTFKQQGFQFSNLSWNEKELQSL